MESVVVVTSKSGLTEEVTVRSHRFLADEPKDAGGADSGPNPYELLLAALGTCTAMTVQMYAKRKGWPLERVQVKLSEQRIHAEDCATCDSAESRITLITKELALEGVLDEAQRARLAEIAAHCPVHRTLMGEIRIQQSLKPPSIVFGA